jgi:hypothetical protein
MDALHLHVCPFLHAPDFSRIGVSRGVAARIAELYIGPTVWIMKLTDSV